jgi:uncharacterized protein (DUF1501 family)
VVLELSGGNDGWNTAIPYRHETYYKARPSLAIRRSEILRLTDEVGLHPALGGLRLLYEQGALALLHGVGYPQPEPSHFRARHRWQTASPSRQILPTGWIGRYLDGRNAGRGTTTHALEVSEGLGLSLKGIRIQGMTMDPLRRASSGSASYPDSLFGQRMKAIATHILSGTDTSVYTVSLGGFDTHVNQATRQQQLLKELGSSLQAFSAELSAHDRFQDVLVMTCSEFGRQLVQNKQGGTDHGTANCMFLISGSLRQPGLFNTPDLNLQEPETGDLPIQVDFRQIYATVLHRWLQAEDRQILQASYDYLPLL